MSFTPIVVDRDRYLAQLIRKKWNGMIKTWIRHPRFDFLKPAKA